MCHEVSYSFKSYEILCMPQKEKAALVKTKGKRYTREVSFGVFGIQDTNFGNKKKNRDKGNLGETLHNGICDIRDAEYGNR